VKAGIICQRYARPVALLDGMTGGWDANQLKYKTCGSELARECDLSFNIDGD
jgi:hypothetical protein